MMFDKLQFAMDTVLKQKGFSLTAAAVDNHGGLEWRWVARVGKTGSCYVAVDVMETETGKYDVEIWAAADDGRLFGRELVREVANTSHPESAQAHDAIIEGMELAADRAKRLSADKLSDKYVR